MYYVVSRLLAHAPSISLLICHNISTVEQKAMRHIRKCQSELLKAQLLCAEGSDIVTELQLTADLMLSACRLVLTDQETIGHRQFIFCCVLL